VSPTEQKVLASLAARFVEDGCYIAFATIQRETKLERSVVRRACRSLTRKGLAVFGKGLWTEAGEPRGAGYSATKEGVAAVPEASTTDLLNRSCS